MGDGTRPADALFGARFRMNAARALLLPRGNPRRRMPLWLQRLKSLDLLQAVREFPSFPILVETYRDVLQDAFDMAGLRDVLARLGSGALTLPQRGVGATALRRASVGDPLRSSSLVPRVICNGAQ